MTSRYTRELSWHVGRVPAGGKTTRFYERRGEGASSIRSDTREESEDPFCASGRDDVEEAREIEGEQRELAERGAKRAVPPRRLTIGMFLSRYRGTRNEERNAYL